MPAARKKKESKIYIAEDDLRRLTRLLDNLEASQGQNIDSGIELLRHELGRAKVMSEDKIPGDVITMDSRFRIRDIDSGNEFVYTLAWPEEADVQENKISILAPVGTGLLGYRVGDTVEWPVPAGVRRFKVEEVLYQPEAGNKE